MNSIDTVTTFLGWCTVLNIGLLLFAGLFWMLVKEGISEFAATMFGVSKDEMSSPRGLQGRNEGDVLARAHAI